MWTRPTGSALTYTVQISKERNENKVVMGGNVLLKHVQVWKRVASSVSAFKYV